MEWNERIPGSLGRIHGLDRPELELGETIAKAGWAALVNRLLPMRGYLWLTNRRLIFHPSRLNTSFLLPVLLGKDRSPVYVYLREAKATGTRSRLRAGLGGFSVFLPVFTIDLKNGSQIAYQVQNARSWRDAIDQLMQEMDET